MANALLVVHVLAAVAIIVLVLLQHGRGADMGAAFGGGSQTLFGARGSANFLSRTTALVAAVFFFTSMSLAFLYGRTSAPKSVTEQTVEQPASSSGDAEIPAVPVQSSEAPVPEAPAAPGEPQSGDAPASPQGGESR